MPFTYPSPPASLSSDLTAVEVHRFMKSPTLIARRLRTLLEQRFIADFLLQGRFQAVGGSILYETGDPIFSDDDPEAIAPGGEYPLSTTAAGALATAKTTKWGRDTEVTDEAISRLLMNPVDRALSQLVNTTVKYVDSITLGVIASKVTATLAASGQWTSADAIIEDVLTAKATVDDLDEGYEIDTVVLTGVQYAKVMAKLLSSGVLPREAANPINTGSFPEYLGITWTTSNHVPGSNPLLVDRTQLGGMADENLDSPGYTSAGGVGVEAKTIRLDDRDAYRLRARRVTVPVVLEPQAGITITGTGL